jgi:outer membrane protein assembly factor BamD (BamD/ComL family)
MEEAEQILKQIQRQFPQETEAHREYLTKAAQEVRLKRATHDWELARYYHRRKEHAAARQYYEEVQQNYRDTNLAGEAGKYLQEIQDKPAKPDPPLPWLSRVFPTPERQKPLVARNPLETLRR